MSKNSFGPFGWFAEIVIVYLGALGIASIIQDFAYFNNPEVITIENTVAKYFVIAVLTVVHVSLIRKYRSQTEQRI